MKGNLEEVWKGVNIYTKSFSHIPNCPINWDHSTKRFYYIPPQPKLIKWYIMNLFVFLYIELGPLHVLLKQVFSPNFSLSPMTIIFLVMPLGLGMFASAVCFAAIFHGEDMVLGLNQLILLEDDLCKRNIKMLPKSQKDHGHSGVSLLTCLVLYLIGPFYVTMAWFVPIAGIVGSVDPMYYFITSFGIDIDGQTFLKKFLYFCLRLVGSQIASLEIFRALPLTIMLYTILSRIANMCCMSIYKCYNFDRRNPCRLKASASLYLQMSLILSVLARFMEITSFLLLGCGIGVDVLSNIITFKLYRVIPIPFYYVFPAFSMFCPIAIQLILPHSCKLFDSSKEMLRDWKSKTVCGKSKRVYDHKKITSLKPLAWKVGLPYCSLFLIKRNIKINYYSAMVYYTITGFMSVPAL